MFVNTTLISVRTVHTFSHQEHELETPILNAEF